MTARRTVRVAVNGYGVIGKRVADAIAMQHDMTLVGISDVAADWRMSIVTRKGYSLYGATGEHARAMKKTGIRVAGTLDELLRQVEVVVDCTPKRPGAKNAEAYRRAGVKFIVEGGEEHGVAGHSLAAEANYTSALGQEATRIVSCNTTSIVRTLIALKRAGLLLRLHCWAVQLTPPAEKGEVLSALAGSPRIAFISRRNGLSGINTVRELMADIGRPYDSLYEVAVWRIWSLFGGSEAFYSYLVDNQAMVIPETIDAIRELAELERAPLASIEKTNSSLGVSSRLLKQAA